MHRGSSTFTQRHTLGGWDLVTEAIDNRALRGCLANARRGYIHTCVAPHPRGSYPVPVAQALLTTLAALSCHTSVTGRDRCKPVAGPAGCSARDRNSSGFRQRERERGTIPPSRPVGNAPGCNVILRRDCREFKVAWYHDTTVATKINPSWQVTMRLGKHEAARSRVRYLCSQAGEGNRG